MDDISTPPSILMVDDSPFNLDILIDALSGDYDIRVAKNGEDALDSVARDAPDLILLDIVMPGIDGYEVCRRLKARRHTQDIPVIFLTSLSEAADEEKGLNIGAIDYITKPFSTAIIKARVKNHLALSQAHKELVRQCGLNEEAYRKLRSLEEYRNDLIHMIVHDIRSSLLVIHGNLELDLRSRPATDAGLLKHIRRSMESTESLTAMATSLLDVSRLESGQMPLIMEECDLAQCVRDAVDELTNAYEGRRVSIESARAVVPVTVDKSLFMRVIHNLLVNAVKFTEVNGNIQLSLTREGACVQLSISDDGRGIPPGDLEKIFQKFSQVGSERQKRCFASGLGLTFCKLAVETLGGSIQVESEVGVGATFHIRLPLRDAAP